MTIKCVSGLPLLTSVTCVLRTTQVTLSLSTAGPVKRDDVYLTIKELLAKHRIILSFFQRGSNRNLKRES